MPSHPVVKMKCMQPLALPPEVVMFPASDPNNGRDAKQVTAADSNGGTGKRPYRKRRLQLSCGECRKKKLSCDRNWPCRRCVRTGRPAQCSFESGTGNSQQARHNQDEIHDLRAEVAQLKELLAKARVQHESSCTAEPTLLTTTKSDLSDPRLRSPRGYYSQHTLFQFFIEVPQLFPLIKETVNEYLKPMGVDLKKNKFTSNNDAPANPQDEISLGRLLPPRQDTNSLVSYYLDHLEPLHRIVHVPTFRREYASFWVPGQTRQSAIEALVLSMISISAFASVHPSDFRAIPTTYRTMPIRWISACEAWLTQQHAKHRKLVHYQISCLVYFARRMHLVRKKEFWKDTASLLQDAIIDRLHCDPPPTDSPYMREMKRRMWTVLRELELQNCFEHCLPSLIHSIKPDVAAPSNLDDQDFDMTSKELPRSKPLSQYTDTSYQAHSSQSWALRLEISQRLYSSAMTESLAYNDVLRYTHELMQVIQNIPPWDIGEIKGENSQSKPQILAYAFLHFQLQECILAIHRPYLQQDSNNDRGKYWLSENVCWNVSRDIQLTNSRLAKLGIQSLTLLREDLLLACLNMTRITMLQPKGSTSIIMTSSESVLNLLEQSLPFTKDRYLRSFYGEPWCFVTLCAAIMLLRVFLGKETWETAKSSLAHRILDLRHEHVERQRTSFLGPRHPLPPQEVISQVEDSPTSIPMVSPASGWLDSTFPDLDLTDLDMDLHDLWEGSGLA